MILAMLNEQNTKPRSEVGFGSAGCSPTPLVVARHIAMRQVDDFQVERLPVGRRNERVAMMQSM
jgi:hypothetical protein